MNRAILTGRIGKDAETKRFENGSMKVSFTLATNEYRKGKDGQREELTEWHSIQMWGERAEKLAEYLTKGKMVLVEGKVSPGRYEADGVVKFSPCINASNVEFLSSSKNDQAKDEQKEQVHQQESAADFPDDGNDDLPF